MTTMIRPVKDEDVPAIRAIYEPMVRDTIVSFETEVPSEDALRKRISNSHEWLVYERARQVIAYAYAAPFHGRDAYRWSVEVSIYVVTIPAAPVWVESSCQPYWIGSRAEASSTPSPG